jgi:hypothetical protein
LNSKSVGENIGKTVVKVEIDTFWIVILTPTAGDGLMIGMVKNNNNKYMMGLFKLFKLYSSDPWILFNLNPGMGFWIKTRFEYWIILRTKRLNLKQLEFKNGNP